jgi:hypothetical protein
MSNASLPKATQSLRFNAVHGHVLHSVWRAFPSLPGRHAFYRAIYVSAWTREVAARKMIAILRTIVDMGAGLPDDWNDGYLLENLSSFENIVDDHAPEDVTTALFGRMGARATGGNSWCEEPIFAVAAPLSGLMSDIWSSLPRTDAQTVPALTCVRLTRAKALATLPTDGSSVIAKTSEMWTDPKQTMQADIELLTSMFGKPDASLGDKEGPHWAVQFPDGIVVHIHNFLKKKYRMPDIWHLSSADSRGAGRVRCVVGDEAVRAAYRSE